MTNQPPHLLHLPKTPNASDVSERDLLDQQIRAAVAPIPAGAPPHIDDDTLIAHLQRGLAVEERAALLHHLARCAMCCDRLEASADALRISDLSTPTLPKALPSIAKKISPAADTSPALPLFDVGRALMQMRVQIGMGGALRIVSTDAEMRVESATLLRRSARSPSIAFQTRVGAAKLQVALLATGAQLQASLSLDPAPAGFQACLLIGGQVVASEPLRLGQAVFRALPARAVTICLRGPGAKSIGHIRLDLDTADDL